jgi:hypothetical protein
MRIDEFRRRAFQVFLNNVSRCFVETTLIAFSVAAADKILRVNESQCSLSRLRFQMSVAPLRHVKLMRAIELLGTRVTPLVRKALSKEAMLPAA